MAGEDAPEVLQPSKEPFDFPAATVAAQHAAILGLGLFSAASMGGDHLDGLVGELSVERIAVVGFVADPGGRVFEQRNAPPELPGQG